MLTYSTLQDRPREFLAATGLTHDEFARVLPAFAAAYAVRYPPDKTWEGKVRHRQSGGGAKGGLPQMEDKLLFILVYEKRHWYRLMKINTHRSPKFGGKSQIALSSGDA
jgi:hypothetical protein